MRYDDDDNIRLYTPVLQRVIILLAVIIAVPVVMWTITTVVRTYFAPPKAPTFQRMTKLQPPGTASDAIQVAPAPAASANASPLSVPPSQIADAGTSAADTHSTRLLEFKKPDVPPPAAVGAPTVSPQIAVASQTSAAPSPTIKPAIPPGTGNSMAPMPAAASPMGGPVTPAASAAPPKGAMQMAANKPDNQVVSNGSFAWPNPNSSSPPRVGADQSAPDVKIAATPPSAVDQAPAPVDNASEPLPPGEPITGRVPLPPRRPVLFAMAVEGQTAIPLPRPRPTDAPAATALTPDTPAGEAYDPGMSHY